MTVARRIITGGVVAAVCMFGGVPAAQACITELPVTHSMSGYSASHTGKFVKVHVRSTGAWIRYTKAELWTFGGTLLAKSKLRKRGFNGGRTFRMRLRYGRGIQSGKYTLVVTGEPNASRSCGPKKYVKVVDFAECPGSLPVDFPDAPGGNARDYGNWLTVHVRTQGPILKRLRAAVYDFSGRLYARGRARVLYGTVRLDMRLRRKLVAGGYSVVVRARGGTPRGCGRVNATKVLTFAGARTSPGGGTTSPGGGTTNPGTGGPGDPDDDDDFWGPIADEDDESEGGF